MSMKSDDTTVSLLHSCICRISTTFKDQILLVNNVWKIQSDEMSGLGVHTSLPKTSSLLF